MPKKSETIEQLAAGSKTRRAELEIIGRMAQAAQGDNDVSLMRTARGYEVVVSPGCEQTIHLHPDGTWEIKP